MNDIINLIEKNYIAAFKEKNILKISTLRMLKSALYNAKISKGKKLDDIDTIAIIRKEIKNRNESIVYLEKAEKDSEVIIEKQAIEILQKYLPMELSDTEIESIVNKSIECIGSKSINDFGKIMGLAMQELKGKTDATMVSSIIKAKLT